jgi:predicted metal-binding membrane protein
VISSPAAARTSAAAVATLGLAAGSWVLAIRQMDEMGRVAGLGSLALFAGVWVSMMAAMMLPGAVPAVSSHARASDRFRAVPVFIGSYLAVRALVGMAIYALYRAHGPVAAGVVVIAAGVYELTPLKQALRQRCRESVRSGLTTRREQ